MDYRPYIELDKDRRVGKACIRGTRIAVADILELLADGVTPAEIVSDFPDLNDIKIKAALSYAADREKKGKAT